MFVTPKYFIALIALELIILIWAAWTASLKESNYLAIPQHKIFEKCARNSGRVSAMLNVLILMMIGHFGLQKIYSTQEHFLSFFDLVSLFTLNHLIHFGYISRNFKRQSMKIKFQEEKRGIFTYICITIFPIFLWYFRNLNIWTYIIILMHLLNVSHVFVMALNTKIRVKSKITIHNKLGMFTTVVSWIYVVYSVVMDVLK